MSGTEGILLLQSRKNEMMAVNTGVVSVSVPHSCSPRFMMPPPGGTSKLITAVNQDWISLSTQLFATINRNHDSAQKVKSMHDLL